VKTADKSRKVRLDGMSLTLEDVANVARRGWAVELDEETVRRVEASSAAVRAWENSDDVVYGITTGFGDLASVNISRKDRRLLQENLLKSHACGVGAPFPEDITRAMMLLRINSLVRGHSGISLAVLNQFVDLLNLGIHPVVPCQGSVGASGDLCPLSHLALPLIGHGSVRYKGRTMAAAKALQMAGLSPVQLGAKEGLALNNGTASMGAMAVLALLDAECLAKTADIAAALSIEALHGVPFAFDPRTHALRPHNGQGRVAGNIRRLIEGSEILEKFKSGKVQDAYSLRCVPQVHGATGTPSATSGEFSRWRSTPSPTTPSSSPTTELPSAAEISTGSPSPWPWTSSALPWRSWRAFPNGARHGWWTRAFRAFRPSSWRTAA